MDKIKSALNEEVKDVKISDRLSESPSCLVKDSSDPMASMAHMFRAMGQEMPEAKPILEINADHEIIKQLNGCPDEALIGEVAHLLLESARLSGGYEIKDPISFASRLNKLMTKVF